MAQAIEYRTLSAPDREIRLLRIDDVMLKCSLQHVQLGSAAARNYIAISYCWGDATKKSILKVDGKAVEVPQSAVSALYGVAQEPYELIWIDAVCINQEDAEEKSSQVGLMKDIYSQAHEVRIWLGDMGDLAINALESVQTIYEQCQRETNNFTDLDKHLYGLDGSGNFTFSEASLPISCNWDSLTAFYSLPWFGRLWVIQELVLARDATCHVGRYCIAAKAVTLAALWMVHRCYTKQNGGCGIDGIENASSMSDPTRLTLSSHLRDTWRRKCTDPRDRVYALLGILMPETAAAIVPDYTLPVVDVYGNALRTAFREDQGLRLLQMSTWFADEPNLNPDNDHVIGTGNPKNWPSWVLQLHKSVDSDKSCFEIWPFEKPHNSLEMRSAGMDPLVLDVKGVIISRVDSVTVGFSKQIQKSSNRLARFVLDCEARAAKLARAEDVPYTMICGMNAFDLTDAERNPILVPQYERFKAWCKVRIANPSSKAKKQSFFHPYIQSLSRSENRRYFTTSDGKIGMGPPDTRIDDHLCLLSGTRAPFVLRRDGSHWRLIGDAYCRPLMKEATLEAVLPRHEREARSEWIAIR